MDPVSQEPRQPFATTRRKHLTGLAALLLTGSLPACDFPTELPKWDTLWVLPGDTVAVSVADLLPAGVTIAPGGEAFRLDPTGVTFSRSIGEMCPACSAFNGLVAPKPAFHIEFSENIALPENVLSANLVGGEVQVQLRHDFSFDPLRPSASARGYIVVTATAGGRTVARDSISGQTTALPPNTTLTRTLTLAPGSLPSPIAISIRVFSPAGDPVVINTNQRLTVTATPVGVEVSEAQVRVANRTITSPSVSLDLTGVDEEISRRVKSGGFRLQVENPFSVSGTVQFRITAPGVNLLRTIPVQPGVSTQRVVFTGEEIQSLLGHSEVVMSVTGSVSSSPEGTAVRPTSTIRIRTQLELTVGPLEN